MERTCSNCRFWDDEPAFGPAFGFAAPDTFRACLNEKLQVRPGCEEGDVFIKGSGIATEPSFGCNQFDAR
jgi:hypothetical protein